MRKKLITFFLTGCMVMAALAGCGEKTDGEEVFQNVMENNGKNDVLPSDSTTEVVEKSNSDGSEEPEEGNSPVQQENNSTSVENTEEKESASGETEAYFLTFEASTVDGEAWNSDKLADAKLTMLNIWATYCNPCLAEMPDLGELAGEYDAADVQIVGIISDVVEGDTASNVAYAKELIAETKADYPHLLTNDSLYWNLLGPGNVSAVPTTFFVNQDREVLGYVMGAQSKETWKSLIDQLLAEME